MSERKLLNVEEQDGGWFVVQPGWKDYGPFAHEDDAWDWADDNVDDQVFGRPNVLAPELRTRIDAQ